ncbi:hypothetical protein [Alsobacter sp. R-9]
MIRSLLSPAGAVIAVLLAAAGLTATPRPAAAACVSCGFDVGSALGGLAIGAIAAGAANRANQPPDGYVLDEPQQPRGKTRRAPPPPAQAMGEDGAPVEPKKKSVAAKPAAKTATAPAAAKSRTVATAQGGALLP